MRFRHDIRDFIVFCLGLVLSFGLFYFFSIASVWDGQKVQKNLHLQITKAEKDVEGILSTLSSREYNFKKLSQLSDFPFFLYKNKSLFYWSSSQIQPIYEKFQECKTPEYIQLKNGVFLCLRSKVEIQKDEYEVFLLLPLYYKLGIRNEFIKSGVNEDIFGASTFKINNYETDGYKYYDKGGKYLFSLESYKPKYFSYGTFNDLLFLGLGISLLWLIFLVGKIWLNKGKYKIERRFLLYFLSYSFIRLAYIGVGGLDGIVELDFFRPNFVGPFGIPVSLGSMFFDTLFSVFFIGFAFRHFSFLRIVQWFLKYIVSNRVHFLVAFLVLACHVSLIVVFMVVGYVSDVVEGHFRLFYALPHPLTMGLTLCIYIGICLFYFLINQMCVRLMLEYTKAKGRKLWFLNFMLATGIYTILMGLMNYSFLFITILSSFYVMMVWYYQLPLSISRLRFNTYMYFFICAIVCATSGSYSFFKFSKERIIQEKRSFARLLLEENDYLAEDLMREAAAGISEDPLLCNEIQSPFMNMDLMEQKIRKIHLNNYFNRYNIKIVFYDKLGLKIGEEPGETRLKEVLEKLKNKGAETTVQNVYFLKNLKGNIVKQYYFFVPLKEESEILGYVIIQLWPKRNIPVYNVYPALLISQNEGENERQTEFDYGIFQDSVLVNASGKYNYISEFNIRPFISEESNEILYNAKGYDHVILKVRSGKMLVVTSPSLPWGELITTFSYLFLLLLFVSTLFVIGYTIFVQKDLFSANFTTKIQIYINLAFFLPLFVISIATIGYVNVMYENELKESYERKSGLVAQEMTELLEKYENKKYGKSQMEEAVLEVARNSDIDLDVYDKKGRLLVSSQPAIYSAGILSNLIDPLAVFEILELQAHVVLLPQKMGDFSYFKVFHTVRSNEAGNVIGIVGLPFFGSKDELNQRRTALMNYMVTIFTLIFIFFLLISYLSARILVVPLKIVTQKMKKVTLTGANEPIQWNSKDEIGILIEEYNQMLVKLKQSTASLAEAEKESAWREMARQVAHEIKNPLTPMKLTLQYFRKRLQEGGALGVEPIDNVLHQIDQLAHISNSFAAFASFPEPTKEPFDLVASLKVVVSLHNNQGDDIVELMCAFDEIEVLGDAPFMERIIHNLIINAKQAIPIGRIPHIEVQVQKKSEHKVCVMVSDNGNGIPLEIRDKIFLPNFSTKYAGSGIGLALAKKGIEYIGGKIWFETEENKGTVFYIELDALSYS